MEAKTAGTNGVAGKTAFADEIRDTVVEEHPDLDEEGVSEEIDRRWGELSEEKKEEYGNRGAEAKSNKRKPAAKAAKPTKTNKKAKRGPNSFMVFANEIRPSIMAENPGISIGESGKLIGARWRALSDAEKESYKQKANRIKEGRDDDEN